MKATSALVVQPGEAGGTSLADGAFELLADGGAVSASRLTLATGADGAPPHHHNVVLSPGTERFGYFEQLAAISRGEKEFASLYPEQDRYDVHLVDLPDWRSAPAQ